MGSDHRAGSELFVCFPSRTTMSLMPKPILSPGRNGDASKRVRSSATRGQSSPMFSIPSKKNSEYQAEEPTSPKVTCAGQVRVKPSKQCKSWQSVMAEIEKLHSHKQRRRASSTSSPGRQRSFNQVVGFKKDLLHFVTALRNLRVDFGCFGAPAVSTDDDEEEEEEEEEESKEATTSGTFLAKWFMMLQDNDDRSLNNFDHRRHCGEALPKPAAATDDSSEEPAVPPPNALLLMRCRSAPSRASLGTDVKAEDGKGKGMSDFAKKSPPPAVLSRRCEPDFAAMLSMDVSKETWVNRRDFNNHSYLRSVSLKG